MIHVKSDGNIPVAGEKAVHGFVGAACLGRMTTEEPPMCGWTLAHAHARTGDRIAIAAYLGGSDKFDQAVAEFAETYAGQTEADRAALANAVTSGRVQAQMGI